MYAMTNATGTAARGPMAMRLQTVSAASADPLDRLGATVKCERNRTIYFEGDEAEH